jgi:organic radical activating enzyme
MKKKARVILTLKCPRNCSYCANKAKANRAQMQPLKDIEDLKGYDQVILTGGEPLLEVLRLNAILRKLNTFRPIKIYLYTAIWMPFFEEEVANFLDGITFTMHPNQTGYYEDGAHFQNMQLCLNRLPKEFCASRRLRIFDGAYRDLILTPGAWTDIAKSKILGPEECLVPEDEDLFLFTGAK